MHLARHPLALLFLGGEEHRGELAEAVFRFLHGSFRFLAVGDVADGFNRANEVAVAVEQGGSGNPKVGAFAAIGRRHEMLRKQDVAALFEEFIGRVKIGLTSRHQVDEKRASGPIKGNGISIIPFPQHLFFRDFRSFPPWPGSRQSPFYPDR